MFGEKRYFITRGIVVIGLLFLSTLMLAVSVSAGGNIVLVDDNANPSWYNDTQVKTIQEGINNVTQNGTVYVWNGNYSEHVIVNKSLTLEGNSSTFLDGFAGYAMNISLNNTVIQNITVTNSSTGIYIYNASWILQNITLNNLTICNSTTGIYLENITHCNITNCNITNNTNGINLNNSSNNTIYNNFLNNTNNAIDDGNNIWNTTKTLGTNIVGRPYLGGNYWNDYSGVDTDGDGIGNTSIPYNTGIDNGGDYLPLVTSSPPMITDENPANGSIDQPLWPECNVTVIDVDNDLMNVSFYYQNESGSWKLQQENNDVASGTIVILSNFTNASNLATLYNWSVNVTDGNSWTNETYNFTTLINYIPDPPASFSANVMSSSRIDLSWTKGNKADYTMVRRKTGGYPTKSTGDLVTNETGTSESDTGLSPLTQYYYRAWSWNNTGKNWSNSYSQTTKYTEEEEEEEEEPPGPGPSGDATPPTDPTDVECTSPESDNTPSFSWDASTDLSDILGYYVKIDDGTDIWAGSLLIWESSTHIEDGVHKFYVRAKDASIYGNIGNYSNCTFTINTSTIGDSPVADPSGPYTGFTYQEIYFNGSSSYDSDGTITNYTWDFGDSTKTYEINPTHIYNHAGIYNVTLTVTDNDSLLNSKITIATIILDSDGDGWSDEIENAYGTDAFNETDNITDTDNDGIPDDNSLDGNYTGDLDDDNDGLDDLIEDELGSNSKNNSDIKNINNTIEGGYLVDINVDGTFDKFYSSTSKINTTIAVRSDGKYNIDTDGNGKWNYIYNPTSGIASTYKKEISSGEFPWVPVIGVIILIVIILIILLYKPGYKNIEKLLFKKIVKKRDKKRDKKTDKKIGKKIDKRKDKKRDKKIGKTIRKNIEKNRKKTKKIPSKKHK